MLSRVPLNGLRAARRCYAGAACEAQAPGAAPAFFSPATACGDVLAPGALTPLVQPAGSASTTSVRVQRSVSAATGAADGRGTGGRGVGPGVRGGGAAASGAREGQGRPSHHSSGLDRSDDDDDEHGVALGHAAR